ncbi:MAG: NHLP leader peptide family RiPP precursor [Chlamydiales bacterium]
MSRHETLKNKWAEIVAKAWIDPKFKHKLLQHPDEVLREMKLKMPGNVRLNIVENTQDMYYLVLPEKPVENLSETELKKIAAAAPGGYTTNRGFE